MFDCLDFASCPFAKKRGINGNFFLFLSFFLSFFSFLFSFFFFLFLIVLSKKDVWTWFSVWNNKIEFEWVSLLHVKFSSTWLYTRSCWPYVTCMYLLFYSLVGIHVIWSFFFFFSKLKKKNYNMTQIVKLTTCLLIKNLIWKQRIKLMILNSGIN